jgi:hypothetical protein
MPMAQTTAAAVEATGTPKEDGLVPTLRDPRGEMMEKNR